MFCKLVGSNIGMWLPGIYLFCFEGAASQTNSIKLFFMPAKFNRVFPLELFAPYAATVFPILFCSFKN